MRFESMKKINNLLKSEIVSTPQISENLDEQCKIIGTIFFWLHFKWQGCQAWKYVMVHNRGKYYSLWLKDQIRRVQYTMAYNTYERSHFSFWITAPSSISSWDHKKMICWISLAHCVSLRLWAFIEMCSIIWWTKW